MLIILLFSIEPLVYRSFSIDRYLYTLPLRKTCQLLQRNTMADDDDAVPFAWCPAMATDRGMIDYSSREGQNLYRASISCMYADKTNCFSMKPEGLPGFLNHLSQRANESDWWHLLKVPQVYDEDTPPVSILTNYGTFTMEYLKEYIETMHPSGSRWHQDNFQCQQCIFNSLSEEALNKVNLHMDEITVDIEINGEYHPQIQALLLIKLIIREARVETPHRTRIIRQRLGDLEGAIARFGYDISMFNTYVLGLLADLTAMGETTHDVLANLFRAYLTAPDEGFKAYITQKQSEYDEGTPTNENTLMTYALNKYMGKMDQGDWNAPSADQIKILALETQVASLVPKNNDKKRRKDDKDAGKSNKKAYKPSDWQKNAPTELEAKTNLKKVNGKEYKWCANHKLWCAHSTAECRGTGNAGSKSATDKPAKTDDPKKDKTTDKKNAIVSAFNAIALEQSDSDDDDIE